MGAGGGEHRVKSLLKSSRIASPRKVILLENIFADNQTFILFTMLGVEVLNLNPALLTRA